MNRLTHNYPASIVDIVDGRTFNALVDRGWRDYSQKRLRLSHLNNMPELKDKNPELSALAQRAKQCLDLAIRSRKVILAPSRPDSHGRAYCRAYISCRNEMAEITVNYAQLRFLDVVKFMLHLNSLPTPFDTAEANRILNQLETQDV